MCQLERLLGLNWNLAQVCRISSHLTTVADPEFPVEGARPRTGGGADSQGGYVSKILYVETKESGPLGACTGHAP